MDRELRVVNAIVNALVAIGFPLLASAQLVLVASRAPQWVACMPLTSLGAVEVVLVALALVTIAAAGATSRALGETEHFRVSRGAVIAAIALLALPVGFSLFLSVFSTWVGVFYVAVPAIVVILLLVVLRSRSVQRPVRRPIATTTSSAIAAYGVLLIALAIASAVSCSAMLAG